MQAAAEFDLLFVGERPVVGDRNPMGWRHGASERAFVQFKSFIYIALSMFFMLFYMLRRARLCNFFLLLYPPISDRHWVGCGAVSGPMSPGEQR